MPQRDLNNLYRAHYCRYCHEPLSLALEFCNQECLDNYDAALASLTPDEDLDYSPSNDADADDYHDQVELPW